jgi:hypothetical protein
LQGVGDMDEWLCEAYMETDYSTLKISDFEQSVKDFVAFKVRNDKNDQ